MLPENGWKRVNTHKARMKKYQEGFKWLTYSIPFSGLLTK